MIVFHMVPHGPEGGVVLIEYFAPFGLERAEVAFVDDGKDWRAVVMIVFVDEAGIEGHWEASMSQVRNESIDSWSG